MGANTVTAYRNPRSKLYRIEYQDSNTKSVISLPRWVNSERTLRMWIQDRIADKTVPPWFVNVVVEGG